MLLQRTPLSAYSAAIVLVSPSRACFEVPYTLASGAARCAAIEATLTMDSLRPAGAVEARCRRMAICERRNGARTLARQPTPMPFTSCDLWPPDACVFPDWRQPD